MAGLQELSLDGNPRTNLASYMTTYMDPECEELMMVCIASRTLLAIPVSD